MTLLIFTSAKKIRIISNRTKVIPLFSHSDSVNRGLTLVRLGQLIFITFYFFAHLSHLRDYRHPFHV